MQIDEDEREFMFKVIEAMKTMSTDDGLPMFPHMSPAGISAIARVWEADPLHYVKMGVYDALASAYRKAVKTCHRELH